MTGWRPALIVISFLAFDARRVEAAGLDDFARCLSRERATYYTASWCPYCARQNDMFGAAVRYLRTVDCSHGCASISSFPTWVFADGSRFSGVVSLAPLGSRTGCRLGDARSTSGHEAGARMWSGRGMRERSIGGAKFIDVPR